jgi:UDP-N-acetylmuramoyl-L-alanyl-D-glutamate--2,6-diaminopimelate ligase
MSSLFTAIITQLRQNTIQHLSLLSRELNAHTAFIALQGAKHHGLDFMAEAQTAGCRYVLVDADDSAFCKTLGKGADLLTIIPIKNLSQNLGNFAAEFYGYPSQKLKIHAVTGTNGKTSCSQFIAQALTLLGERCGVIGTLGMGIWPDLKEIPNTTPDAISLQRFLAACVEVGVKHVSMEVSSIAIEQGRMQACFLNSAIFTNLTQDHLDYHGTMEAYGEAKRKLFAFPGLQHKIINADDLFGKTLVAWAKERSNVPAFLYSCGEHTRLSPSEILALNADFTVSGIRAQIQTRQGIGELKSPLLGQFNLENLLAVLSWMLAQEIPLEKALSMIPKLKSVKGRLEMLSACGKPSVVIDYAHTPDALEKALKALRQHCDGKLWCVFGCGGNRDKTKRPLMGRMAMQYADHVVITSDNPRDEAPTKIMAEIALGIHGAMLLDGCVTMLLDRAEAIKYAINHATPGDIILIAGKGHENYQEIRGEKFPFDDAVVAKKLLTLSEHH